jgi:hypothetical protein
MGQKNVLYKLTPKQLKSRLHKVVFSINPYGRLGYTKADRLGNRTYAQALATNPYAGIYRRRRRKGKLYIQKAPFYKPTNMQTEKQQAWRKIFADACFMWFRLSAGEKRFYELWGAKYKMSGWNKFISEYCKSQYAQLVK